MWGVDFMMNRDSKWHWDTPTSFVSLVTLLASDQSVDSSPLVCCEGTASRPKEVMHNKYIKKI